MLLAAGRGERLRPLTDTLPKPLMPVGGGTLIDHHLRALAAADVRRVVINLSWLGPQIRAAVGDGTRYGLEVRYSDEGDEALETGGGVARALPLLGDAPFLVINGDVWCDVPLATLRLSDDDLAQVVLVSNPAHHQRGDFSVEGDRLCAPVATTYTFSGIGLYRPAFFAGRPERFSLAEPLRAFAAERRVGAQVFAGRWFDIGTPARLRALQDWISGSDRPAPAVAGR